MKKTISGHYYNELTNRYEDVDIESSREVLESPNYDNPTWMKRNAAIGFLGGYTIYDMTGDATFEFGEDVEGHLTGEVITVLRENF